MQPNNALKLLAIAAVGLLLSSCFDPNKPTTSTAAQNDLSTLIEAVRRAGKPVLHEGLPHDFWEKRLLERVPKGSGSLL